jgi:hypothetical protein
MITNCSESQEYCIGVTLVVRVGCGACHILPRVLVLVGGVLSVPFKSYLPINLMVMYRWASTC